MEWIGEAEGKGLRIGHGILKVVDWENMVGWGLDVIGYEDKEVEKYS